MQMDRRHEVLKAIVQHFINTAEPVGSNTILISYKFSVSPATIRNDMASLEKEGLIYQPHTSAGRIPTDLGYRLFVDEIADYSVAKAQAIKALKKAQTELHMKKVKEKIYDIVSLLAHATNNVSFSTLPDNPRTFYIGLSNMIKQPEFVSDNVRASQVIEVFEKNDSFISLLRKLEIDDSIKIFIGKENILPEIHSCSLIVTQIKYLNHINYVGLLGPTRMDYAFNKAILEEVKKLI